MPIYEYQCTKCDHYLEALQRISDKPLRECPECGRHTLQRLMSAPMFRLAGSGWYETDFKSDKEQKRNLAGDKGEPAEPASAAEKVEAKPEAKPEAKETPAKGAEEKKARRSMVTKPSLKSKRQGKPARSAARKPAARARQR